VTAEELALSSALPMPLVDASLLALEGEGFVLRGSFTGRSVQGASATQPAGTRGFPTQATREGATEGGMPAERGGTSAFPPGTEWCERRLLARIHRATLHRLRREIEPVSLAEFQRFLLAWQRVAAGSRLTGIEGLAGVLEQLAGFEAPAAAWEADLLPARVERYEPAWLDMLCLSGRAAWARLTPPPEGRELRGGSPIRSTPIALGARAALAIWAQLAPDPGETAGGGESLSSPALAVREHLMARGASFLREIGPVTGLLTTQVEQALAELVAAGLVTCDSFSGLRALLAPQDERPAAWRRASLPASSLEMAGRWSSMSRGPSRGGDPAPGDVVEIVARSLLARYGIVFRKLIAREDHLPPWRELLRVYHRLEARGEIRGGRFVGGPSGEQFALPEAIARLRAIRREPQRGELISLCAADPLSLVGVLLPGRRLPALASNRLLLRDGEPIAILEGRQISFLVEIEGAARWEAEKALLRRPKMATAPISEHSAAH
jgi:ATP-dependent Lhr-like helicase